MHHLHTFTIYNRLPTINVHAFGWHSYQSDTPSRHTIFSANVFRAFALPIC